MINLIECDSHLWVHLSLQFRWHHIANQCAQRVCSIRRRSVKCMCRTSAITMFMVTRVKSTPGMLIWHACRCAQSRFKFIEFSLFARLPSFWVHATCNGRICWAYLSRIRGCAVIRNVQTHFNLIIPQTGLRSQIYRGEFAARNPSTNTLFRCDFPICTISIFVYGLTHKNTL